MTNRLALTLGLLLLGALAADVIFNGGAATLFTLRKGLALLGWVAFWR